MLNETAKRIIKKLDITWYTLISTWFYIGRIPFAPGTLGSIATYPLYLCIAKLNIIPQHKIFCLYFLAAFFTIIGYIAVRKFQIVYKVKDHKSIVIDEVVGQLLILAISAKWIMSNSTIINLVNTSIYPLSNTNISFLISLAVFRFFDIKKPLYIWYIDKKITNAFGVILDDIMAAVWGSAFLYILCRFL